MGEKREKGESSKVTFSHLSHRGNKKWLDASTVVIWLSLGNLQKSDWLFEEKWKCKATDEQLVEYYLIHKERECRHYEKRPELAPKI